MANWSQSHFLQSLGWATLNSFWQMALLWCIYVAAAFVFNLTSHRKYQLSVIAVLTGFIWFVFSFVYFFQNSTVTSLAFFNQAVSEADSLLRVLLLSASLSYLGLLVFPSYRLFKNWQFVQKIKKEGLHKADLGYRLFVQKIAAQLGIKKKVWVHLSELVKSPVTIGYLKPVILLPVAALNNLSTQQVEAILLHELSHIRRYDYLINLLTSIISTILYFNPFVKQFMRKIEEERENCCDQLVLQFGYDKVGYASALLTLERLTVREQLLAIGATGKNYLLSRIEKIVGMEKKKGFKRNQFAGLLAAVFCIVIFNSILIIKEEKGKDYSFAYNNLSNPFSLYASGDASTDHSITPGQNNKGSLWVASAKTPLTNLQPAREMENEAPAILPNEVLEPALENALMHVAADDVDLSLTAEEKQKVKSTIDATKKVISTMQWKEINNDIADAMTEKEKVEARKEYMQELDKTMNWKNMEQNMKASYEQLDWNKINHNISNALATIKLDSLENNYEAIIVQLNKANTEICQKSKVNITPLPDQSVEEIRKSTDELRRKVETLKALRSPKKVVRL